MAFACYLLLLRPPPNDARRGVYFLLERAKRFFSSGHVLLHINRRTRVIDHSKDIPYRNYVIFWRSALNNIAASNLFTSHSVRARGTFEAAAQGLQKKTFSTSLELLIRHGCRQTFSLVTVLEMQEPLKQWLMVSTKKTFNTSLVLLIPRQWYLTTVVTCRSSCASLARSSSNTAGVVLGGCVYGGNTRSSLDSRYGCGLPTCVQFTPNTHTCLLLVLVTVLLQAQHRSDYLPHRPHHHTTNNNHQQGLLRGDWVSGLAFASSFLFSLHT